jgi:riboflavin kinase / FMN adenylyltransferase
VTILHSIEELSAIPGPVVLAIGVFDGVHLGHQAVIRHALDDAVRLGGTAVVVTFDPHPARILRPDKAPRILTATVHKARLIEALGVSHLLVIPFDRALADTPPDVFVRELHAACKPLREICVGHEWRFGKNRAGNLAMLRELGDELGFDEVGVRAVESAGGVISSTRVREAVENGDLDEASRCLGRPCTILGTVIDGDKRGRELGFPTANISAHSEQFPPDGVYAVRVMVRSALIDGVANVGTRPTVHPQGERVLEAHLLDYNETIYGEEIEVVFHKHLRPERRFSSLDELRGQIAADVADARRFFTDQPSHTGEKSR